MRHFLSILFAILAVSSISAIAQDNDTLWISNEYRYIYSLDLEEKVHKSQVARESAGLYGVLSTVGDTIVLNCYQKSNDSLLFVERYKEYTAIFAKRLSRTSYWPNGKTKFFYDCVKGEIREYYESGKKLSYQCKGNKGSKQWNEEGKHIPFVPSLKVPEYTGGERALMDFIKTNLKYPAKCAKRGIQGQVRVAFWVSEDGVLEDFVVLQNPHKALTEEALRVIKLMPKWVPGKNEEDQPIRFRYLLPITFRLN